jgi:hypothetical protein
MDTTAAEGMSRIAGLRWAVSGMLLAFALAFVCSGCKNIWVHENWWEGRFEQDAEECQAQTIRLRAQGADAPRWTWCMLDRGWEMRHGLIFQRRSRPK